MTTNQRRREILHRVLLAGYVEAGQLARDLAVDQSTIRRDLDALAQTGQLLRVHGGARAVDGAGVDLPYAMKQHEQLAQKTAIAAAACALVNDGDTILLDSGTTTYQLAIALRARQGLTVITNDLHIGSLLATYPDLRLIVMGGELLGGVFTLLGTNAVELVQGLSVIWTFLGADAIEATGGITNTNLVEVPLKRAMLAAAQHPIVLADSSKFGYRALARVADIADVEQIITDNELPENEALAYGGRVHRVPAAAASSILQVK
ncbi:DeoR family transcriptional regulator [Ktedonobacteria bacterium brp13]|nr:DeoR family transcriptional regulator [Ktedonobacteria bacterium brp13]